jgi:hypothetical protein
MRKSKSVLPTSFAPTFPDLNWLDIDHKAWVDVTSEEQGYPIESALRAERRGWRAANPGLQRIRLMFHEPQRLRRIWLVFEDTENTRTQEFVLRWLPVSGYFFREIVRQQWNFSSPDSVREIEDYTVDLSDVHVLELLISPDKKDSEARASLLSFRLA